MIEAGLEGAKNEALDYVEELENIASVADVARAYVAGWEEGARWGIRAAAASMQSILDGSKGKAEDELHDEAICKPS
jgi:hypothetical protein